MRNSRSFENLLVYAVDTVSLAHISSTNLAPRDSGSKCGANACEKPTSSSTFTLPIILGVAVPLVGAAILFIILQRRHVRKQREEDANDRHASLDFGLGDVSIPRHTKDDKSSTMVESKTKMSQRQISMDLSMNSPYLPSLEMKNSRDSLNSLSKPLHQEDPYRPVSQLANSDAASIRSQIRPNPSGHRDQFQPKPKDMSETSFTNQPASKSNFSHRPKFPPRQNSLASFNSSASKQPFPELNQYISEPPPAHFHSNSIITPPVAPNGASFNCPQQNTPVPNSHMELGCSDDKRIAQQNIGESVGTHVTYQHSNFNTPPVSDVTELSQFRQNILAPIPIPQIQFPQGSNLNNPIPNNAPVQSTNPFENYYLPQPPLITAPTNHLGESARLRPDNSRLNPNNCTVLSHPLPPEEITETDDPEVRANRIRSFYKEYFEENSSNLHQRDEIHQKPNDQNICYNSTASNFVLPYTQPATRRAMTPPPRIMPQALHHMRNTSLHTTNRSRNWSVGTANREWYDSPNAFDEPRPQSSVSSRPFPQERRPIAPPVQLDPLPAPSRLHNDVSIMDPVAFAPPASYREVGSSNPEIPFPGPRYFPQINNHAELAPVPSPHMLSDSAAYSPVTFAPPKKFRDCDNNSDARSISSNRSGKFNDRPVMSRNGSYQVDQLPDSVIFTKDSLNSTLKPTWDMIR